MKMYSHAQPKFYVVSMIAYLIGVLEQYFGLNGPLLLTVYNELNENPAARLIRALCQIRTAFETHFTDFIRELQSDFKHLDDLPQYIPPEVLAELHNQKISTDKANWDVTQYVIWINELIVNRICHCKALFPEWLSWKYVKSLFIMPKGTTRNGVKEGGNHYNKYKVQLPYQQYINWTPRENESNLLRDDLYFSELLYRHNGDQFRQKSCTLDADPDTREAVKAFLKSHTHAVIAVDCENADPIKTFGMFAGMDFVSLREHIDKVILYSDPNASRFWSYFASSLALPTEHREIERVNPDKSRVDMNLALDVKNKQIAGADGCMIISSDSDYITLTEMIPELDYIFVLEKEKSSFELPAALEKNGAQWRWIDDFCTEDSQQLANRTVKWMIRQELEGEAASVDLTSLFDQILRACRWTLSAEERASLYEAICKNTVIRFDASGVPKVEIEL